MKVNGKKSRKNVGRGSCLAIEISQFVGSVSLRCNLFIYTIIDALRATVVLRLHSAANDAFLYINVFIRRQEMRNLAITSIKKVFDQQHALDINFSYTPFSILRIALSKRIVKKKKKKRGNSI